MFDLHSHFLPGIDDGATDLSVSLAMARMAVAQGVQVQACTPHIMPGAYDNTGPGIRQAVADLQDALDREGIPLRLTTGADVHLVPDLVEGLQSGHLLTIADSRYVLVEPPHHVAPARLVDMFFNVLVAGYQPILTHPERLGWIRQNYGMIQQLADGGVWMQITCSSLTGAFGKEPLYWAERMLAEGRVHILASDAHNTGRRPPNMLEGRAAAEKRVGSEEAERLVYTRPLCVLNDQPPASVPGPTRSAEGHKSVSPSSAGGASYSADVGKTRSGQSYPGQARPRGALHNWAGRLRRLVRSDP